MQDEAKNKAYIINDVILVEPNECRLKNLNTGVESKKIEPIAYQLLVYFCEYPKARKSNAQICDAVDLSDEYSSLRNAITKIRNALKEVSDDSEDYGKLLKNEYKMGYYLNASCEPIDDVQTYLSERAKDDAAPIPHTLGHPPVTEADKPVDKSTQLLKDVQKALDEMPPIGGREPGPGESKCVIVNNGKIVAAVNGRVLAPSEVPVEDKRSYFNFAAFYHLFVIDNTDKPSKYETIRYLLTGREKTYEGSQESQLFPDKFLSAYAQGRATLNGEIIEQLLNYDIGVFESRIRKISLFDRKNRLRAFLMLLEKKRFEMTDKQRTELLNLVPSSDNHERTIAKLMVYAIRENKMINKDTLNSLRKECESFTKER